MYITVDELISPVGYFTNSELEQYSTQEGETIDLYTDRIEAIITQRSEEIDSYLRGRYILPISLDNVGLLKDVCKNLVSYDLVSNRGNINERVKSWETRGYSILEKLQKGEILILTTNESDVRYTVSEREKLFNWDNY